MKIGDYVTTEVVMNQSAYKWVVLVDLVIDDGGIGVLGGVIKFIEDTKTEASRKAKTLYEKDVDALLIPGLPDETCILGGVLVK